MFAHFYHLNRHKQSHSRETKFQCSACQKKFKSASELTRHKESHSREKVL